MAVRRDINGVIDVQEFENHLKAQLRQEGYMEIIMYVPDSNISIASINSSDKLDICNIDTVKDIKKYTNVTVATLEENLWLLNGRFPNYQGNRIDGYISNSVSNENGEFTTNPKMNIELARTSNVENFSLILNPAVPTGYPKQVKLNCYDSGGTLVGTYTKDIEWQEDTGDVDENEQPIMTTKLLDTLPSVNFELNSDNVYNMEVEFVGTRFRHRRIRVSSVMFGRTIYLNQDQILNVDYLDKTSFVPDTLPSRTFSFDVNNYEGIYNVDNPNNGYVKLNKQTRVQFRNGYNVSGYQYDEDGYVEFENGFPIINNEEGITEIEWDDWKELRLMDVSANADESATFTCGSVLDIMEDTYTQEMYPGNFRTVEEITNQILTFEGLDTTTIEWSADNNGTSYKLYQINTPVPDTQCKQIIQLLAFAIGATILIKDNGKIGFANLNLSQPSSFTHQFNWNYNDFESIPAAEQLESISNINELSIPKYRSHLKEDGDITFTGADGRTYTNCSIVATVNCNAINNDITYSECYPVGYRKKEGDTSTATPVQGTLYTRRGILTLGGVTEGETTQIEIIGYPVQTQEIQERDTTNDSLVLETQLIYKDDNDSIKQKYLEWYKKKFKYKITTRGEPLVDAGDYGIIQTQFSSSMPVYILQNHWTFDGTWSGDMEVIALG